MAVSQQLDLYQKQFRAMGSPCQLKIYAPNAAQAATALQAAQVRIQTLEQKYSRYQPHTITSRINAAAGGDVWVALDPETYQLFRLAQQGFDLSGGLFDITSGILRQVWDFRQGICPQPEALAQILPRIGWDQVQLKHEEGAPSEAVSGWSVRLPQVGMEIDFGGLVKEYAADAAATALSAQGVAHGFVDLGGDLSVIGPHPEKGAWPIGVRDPRAPSRPIGRLHVSQGGLATSGDYERYFEQNGERYCHILNPKTGWPVRGFASVTVVAQPCVVAGMASTIAMLKGVQDGLAWLQALGTPFFAVIAPDPLLHSAVRPSGDLQAANAGQSAKQNAMIKTPSIVTDQSTSAEIDQLLEVLTD